MIPKHTTEHFANIANLDQKSREVYCNLEDSILKLLDKCPEAIQNNEKEVWNIVITLSDLLEHLKKNK